jgi:DME family drug/metabolite transporter
MIALAATAWGTGGVVATVLFRTTGLGPLAVSFWRFAGGTALLGVGHLLTRARRRPGPRVRVEPGRRRPGPRVRVEPGRTVVLGVGLALYQTAYFAGCAWAGVAVATVVTLGAGPVLIALGARAALAERLGRAGVVTVLVALAGLVALVGAGDDGQAPHRLAGVGWALLSAVGYAVVTLLTRARAGRAGESTPSPMLATLAVGALALLPFALVDGVLPAGGQGVRDWAMLGYLAAVPTVAAYRMFFAALAHVRATTAAVVALLEAVVAALLALLLLGETLDAQAWLGITLLLGAVAGLTVAEGRARPA